MRVLLFVMAAGLTMLQGQRTPFEKNIGIGVSADYGSFYTPDSYFIGLKIPYAFSDKLEAGIELAVFASNTDIGTTPSAKNNFGGIGGAYVEATLLKLNKLKITVPVGIGFGSIGYSLHPASDFIRDNNVDVEDWDPLFVTAMGINCIFKVSDRSFFEITSRYRSSGNIKLIPDYPQNIRGLSVGIGFKTFLFQIK